MGEYRIFIPTAGIGSRLKGLSKHINKALVTVNNKPIISHIIEKFSKDVEIVIALGYKGDAVRDYLEIAYPDRKFIFVEVDKYEGEGSGLGYTLLACKEHLQCPFIFCSNDTIVEEDIPNKLTSNWMGYARGDNDQQYRTLVINDAELVTDIVQKGIQEDAYIYIGLAGIKDYNIFWQAMEDGVNEGSIEIGESFGLRCLVNRLQQGYLYQEVWAEEFTWFDTGNTEALAKTREHFEKDNKLNILEKENEAIWFVNGKVIKFSIDEEFIKSRVKRAKHLGHYIPEITDVRKNMYSYTMVGGEIFSNSPKVTEFQYFLDWMKNFWEVKTLSTEKESDRFDKRCLKFYKDKTYKRVKEYFTRFEQIDAKEIINGQQIPKIYELLERVNWESVSMGYPVRFHGDLHFENILVRRHSATSPFVLLDWRQDFEGSLTEGDIYYDFAKLYHGLIISHEIIRDSQFSVERNLNIVNYDFLRKQSLVECEHYLKEYVIYQDYNWHTVEILTALIFLNIAALHHYPYSLLLFYLGKSMLFNLLKEDKHD